MKITDSKPIHKFMKDVITRGQIIDKTGFNIDDYIINEFKKRFCILLY